MADSHAHEQTHPYHLVDPSPWPLIGALSGFVMASGALLVMHHNSYWLLIIGTIMVMGLNSDFRLCGSSVRPA